MKSLPLLTSPDSGSYTRPMKKLALLGVLAVLCASCRTDQIEKAVSEWLVNQQRETGLLGNQEDDDFSGIYPNALAAICFVREGDVHRAEKIFDFYNSRFDTEFAAGTPGGFHQFWNAKTGAVYPDTDRWIGDNAWLLIALNYYQRRVDRHDYSAMRTGIAKWLISLQDADGGVLSGFTKTGPMTHKSTEGNLDCYAALVDYPENRAKVLGWLRTKMWVEQENSFRMGSTVAQPALDGISWGVAALGREYSIMLPVAEERFARVDKAEGSGNEVAGFADFVGKKRVWLEGTGQMAVAYNVAGDRDKAQNVLRQLERAMVRSARFPGALGIPCSTSDPAWAGATQKIFVPSQTWYLFGRWNFNPMGAEL